MSAWRPKAMDDMPPERRDLVERAQDLGRSLRAVLPPEVGFALLLFGYGDNQWLTYLSSAERDDMIATMEELLVHLRSGPAP